MKFSSFYEFKKELLPRQLYEEIRYAKIQQPAVFLHINVANPGNTLRPKMFGWVAYLCSKRPMFQRAGMYEGRRLPQHFQYLIPMK